MGEVGRAFRRFEFGMISETGDEGDVGLGWKKKEGEGEGGGGRVRDGWIDEDGRWTLKQSGT